MNCSNGVKNYIPMQPENGFYQDLNMRTGEEESMYSVRQDYVAGQYPQMQQDIQPPIYISENYAYANAVEQIPYEASEMIDGYMYTPGFLRSNIGKLLRVEFLIGKSMTTRVGVLREVGANYIVLGAPDNGSKMMCDLCSVKFVTVLQSPESKTALGSFL